MPFFSQSLKKLFVCFVLFLGFTVAPTPLGSYGDLQLLLVEEDPTHTNIENFRMYG